MRELVHDPMNTVSTAMSRIGVPGSQAHVGQRPAGGGRACIGSANGVGVGHRAVDGG